MLRIIVLAITVILASPTQSRDLPPFPWTELEWDEYGVEYAALEKARKAGTNTPPWGISPYPVPDDVSLIKTVVIPADGSPPSLIPVWPANREQASKAKKFTKRNRNRSRR